MDGVPIGQKVDLTAYGGYAELSAAVGKLFRSLLAAQRDPAAAAVGWRCGEEAAGEEAEEPVISGEYTLVYEVEDGDRVLVGDVPWDFQVMRSSGKSWARCAHLRAANNRHG
ncbi:auxin-responsive protein IAA16-like isoform X1 [Setaria italica]|uniref:auxin-responsive protein IAA16-like isoform X1 n=1 Tax=Setaria italica TaxID=4555 RepID=UPI000BE5A4C3|nr:auxin-responsive protein IAA16-like isoform X1 [Setaria italica]